MTHLTCHSQLHEYTCAQRHKLGNGVVGIQDCSVMCAACPILPVFPRGVREGRKQTEEQICEEGVRS